MHENVKLFSFVQIGGKNKISMDNRNKVLPIYLFVYYLFICYHSSSERFLVELCDFITLSMFVCSLS